MKIPKIKHTTNNSKDDVEKGWMSPDGYPHILEYGEHHIENLHPNSKKLNTKNHIETINHQLKQGYVRFVKSPDYNHSIHYDKNSKLGKQSALHALDYIDPKYPEVTYLINKPLVKGGDYIMEPFYSKSKARNYINGRQEPDAIKVTESMDFYRDISGHAPIKGWAHSSGHIMQIDPNTEHVDNLPGKLKPLPKQSTGDYHTNIKHAQSFGYARFGKDDDGHYIHFDKYSKNGMTAALHALNFLKPKSGEKIYVNKTAGFDDDRDDAYHINPRMARMDIIGLNEEAPANNVGSGNIAGAGVGPQGEPGINMSEYRSRRRHAEELDEKDLEKRRKRVFKLSQMPPMIAIEDFLDESIKVNSETFAALKVLNTLGKLMESYVPYEIKKALESQSRIILENKSTGDKLIMEDPGAATAMESDDSHPMHKLAKDRGFQLIGKHTHRDYTVHQYGRPNMDDLRIIHNHKTGEHKFELAKDFYHEDDPERKDWIIHKGNSTKELASHIHRTAYD